MPNALGAWIEDGIAATRRASTIADWVRVIAGAVVAVGVLAVVAVIASSDTDVESKTAVVLYLVLSTAVAGALLAAVASALDMLRIHAESVLFNEEDADDEESGGGS